MKIQDLFAEIEILDTNINGNIEISDITINSKEVKKGDAFICLKGVARDGHDYMAEAVRAGAACVIAERKPEDENAPYILVESTRETEAKLWMKWYGCDNSDIKVIGVTGTNGKTSITYMVKQILEDAGYKTAVFGTIKCIIGDYEEESELTTSDPKKLAELFSIAQKKNMDYIVMEFSSHSLEFKKNAGIKNIEVGIFTNLTHDHLEFHKTMENYAAAKAMLFSRCKIGILNSDDKYVNLITDKSASENYFYSVKDESAAFSVREIKKFDIDGSEYILNTPQGALDISTPIAGKIYIYNTAAAAAAGIMLGIKKETIQDALKKVRVKGRLEKLETNTPYSIFLDYAHTPDALYNVLTCVNEFKLGNVITIFGCGGDRDKTKRPEMGKIASEMSDKFIVSSDNSRTENPSDIIADILKGINPDNPNCTVIIDRKKAIEYALDTAQKDDIILIAGKGHEEYIKENGETKHFSEREIVFAHLK